MISTRKAEDLLLGSWEDNPVGVARYLTLLIWDNERGLGRALSTPALVTTDAFGGGVQTGVALAAA